MEQITIGESIKLKRKSLGYTQKEFGELIGKSESSIQKYESGKTEIPLNILEKIAKELGTDLISLMTLDQMEKILPVRYEAAIEYLKTLGYDITTSDKAEYINIHYLDEAYQVNTEFFDSLVIDGLKQTSDFLMDNLLSLSELQKNDKKD